MAADETLISAEDSGRREELKKYPDQDLTDCVIGAAIDVHKALGPGFLERVYETALCIELEERGVSFRAQSPVPVTYKGRQVGNYFVDTLVEDRVLCENTADRRGRG